MIVPIRKLDVTRCAMRRLTKPGQRRVHFNDEGDRRRREVLSRIEDFGLRGLIWHCRESNDVRARQVCLTDVVPHLVDPGVSRLVLESCQHQDAEDRRVLAGAVRKAGGGLSYAHFKPAEDPVLWISDALAWCYGAGGDWRRRVSGLLDGVIDLNRS
ncbi:hypothetical protein JOF41_005658 [Saccharothrix coeruleofusca]|uniref:hypothetical protein n=1 Tax=Saccharothrix coeruleofusca TaxID=33919 RepID=UPI001AE988E9|nr:hypothetical protein [Saccharothrix coeruleofusca]MBP2339480.1 hypothetical protein [Saccharothrix coeruleofusca]